MGTLKPSFWWIFNKNKINSQAYMSKVWIPGSLFTIFSPQKKMLLTKLSSNIELGLEWGDVFMLTTTTWNKHSVEFWHHY
jgi:hypothetical protein